MRWFVPVEVERDRWKRPLIIPEGGGKPIPYQRASSYGEVLDDTYNLRLWEQRQTAIGMAQRDDLIVAAASLSKPESDKNEEKARKSQLNEIVDKAKEASGASKGSVLGTALHKVTERIDRGEDVPVLPHPYQRDVEAFRDATAMLKPVAIEQFVVCDELQAAGTLDRLYEVNGRELLVVGDTKTGSTMNFGFVKIGVQLAVYSRSKGYDPMNGDRTDLGMDQDWAIIVHLPSGSGKCELYWVNLQVGWSLALLSQDVRDSRKLEKADVIRPVELEDLI